MKYDSIVQLRKDVKDANEEKALQAINLLIKNKETVSFQKVASAIGVHKSTLYRNERVRNAIELLIEHPKLFRSADSTRTLLKLEEIKTRQLQQKCTRLEKQIGSDTNYKEQCQKLQAKLKELEEILAERDGEGW